MAQDNVQFTINLDGNAQTNAVKLDAAMEKLGVTSAKTQFSFVKFSEAAIRLNNIFTLASSVVSRVNGAMQSCLASNKAQQEAQTKLAQVMRNTMDATGEQFESILKLTAAQQELGIVGDEVQLAGVQELGTYLEKTESLQKLIPVMNDMVAQQYGMNASQEAAVNIATMMGKVMDGQVGALSRYGYKFDEAQEKILKYGTEAERVATLAEVISQSVGGMNAALAQTPEGRMQQLANRVDDIKERIGQLYVRVQSLFAPILNSIVGAAEGAMSYFENALPRAISAFRSLRDTISALKPIIIGFATAVGVLSVALNWQSIVAAAVGVKQTIAAIATTLWAKAQAVLNAIMSANPIALVIAAIAALTGAITAIIKKYDEWGAAASLLLGPVGAIVNLVMAFRRHWESIKAAFTDGGIIASIKRIGQVMLDALLMPLQQLLELASRLPGVGNLAGNGAQKIEQLRKKMDVWTAPTSNAAQAAIGTNAKLQQAVGGGTLGGGSLSKTDGESGKTTTAVATGGTRNTDIHINVKSLVETINFTGTTSENRREMQENISTALLQILNMAQASVS